LSTTILKGIGEIHQTFLPKGQLGALDEKPYKLDVAKAKELLAKAGLKDGFSVTIDVRHARLSVKDVTALLRDQPMPVIGYIGRGSVKLDLRTIFPHQDADVIDALLAVATA